MRPAPKYDAFKLNSHYAQRRSGQRFDGVIVLGAKSIGYEAWVLDSPASFHAAARWQGRCRVCLTEKEPWDAHHVLAKQYCRREHAALHHPDNALRLCSWVPGGCHRRHTQRQELVPLTCLTDDNLAFVIMALGPGPGYNYLTRNYAGTDLRLEHILDCA